MSDKSHKIDKQALSARYADLLDAQVDADQLQLIDDLETLYTSAGLPARLILEGSQKPGRPPGSPLPYITEVLPDVVNTQRPVVASRRRRWMNRLNGVAAALVAALLVGSLLVVTHLAQRSQQGNRGGQTTASQCIIPQTYNSNAWLFSLHMINTTTGWALGMDRTTGLIRILHSTDGGTIWQDVTPLQLIVKATDASQITTNAADSYFLNACSAWVAQTQPGNAPALLFRTGDGGLTWQQFTLPGSQIRGIDFIDARMGWLTVDVLKNGKFTEEDFYQSVDGGHGWTKIAVSSTPGSDQPGALPFANADNGLTFINATTGWITGALSANISPRLYITHDGGRTWHQQVLPPADGDSRIFKSGTVTGRPQFFSTREGILPVSFWATNSLDVYVTHDGGNSWQSTSLLRIPTPPNLDASTPTPDPLFVDVNHGWVGNTWGAPFLYVTSDSGRHWTKIVPVLNLRYWVLFYYDFVTDKTGWAIGGFNGKSPEPIPPILYKTEDGGKTWTYMRRE